MDLRWKGPCSNCHNILNRWTWFNLGLVLQYCVTCCVVHYECRPRMGQQKGDKRDFYLSTNSYHTNKFFLFRASDYLKVWAVTLTHQPSIDGLENVKFFPAQIVDFNIFIAIVAKFGKKYLKRQIDRKETIVYSENGQIAN